jgi:hypothetical protein
MIKKMILRLLVIAMFIPITLPVLANEMVHAVVSVETPVTKENPKTTLLLNRLAEIKALTKTDLSRSERKSLRKEVRHIRKEMRAINNGVYLSIGAIIIIILLLILIL